MVSYPCRLKPSSVSKSLHEGILLIAETCTDTRQLWIGMVLHVYWGFKTNILILTSKICHYHTEFLLWNLNCKTSILHCHIFVVTLFSFIDQKVLGSSLLCLWRKQSPGMQLFVTCVYQSRNINSVVKYERGLHLAMRCLQFWHLKN
jgi:hypothetical protein